MALVEWTMVFALLCITATVSKQLEACPDGWYDHDDQCYRFDPSDDKNVQEAAVHCGSLRSRLVSVNSEREHSFIQEWLTSHDASRRTWITGGIKDESGTLIWESEGVNISQDYFPSYIARDEKTGQQKNIIVYAYFESLSHYIWSWGSLLDRRPFICELSKSEAWTLYQSPRDFAYGSNESNPSSWEIGPNITILSQDTLFFDYGDTKTSVILECEATGNPPSTYRWLRKSHILNIDEEITATFSPRYSVTNGRLTIINPSDITDIGMYKCEASNKIGKVYSHYIEVTYGFLGQFSNVKPSAVDAVLYMGIDINCPVPPHNTDLAYSWYKSGVQFIRPELNSQYFLSRNGHLYISEVQAADQNEYYCIVFMTSRPGQSLSNHQTPSRTSLGTSINIRGEIANTYGPDIQNKFPQIFPQVPLVGDDIFIECLAFGRLPLEYFWVREDGQLSPSSYTSDHHRVLVIPKARLRDIGAYTCVVKSRHGIANKTVHLLLQARPYFPMLLQNQHLDVGSSFSWSCYAVGLPKPVYYWYKDGILLKTNFLDGIKINKNTMIIDKLEAVKHNGMYECEATNPLGSSRSSAQLRVLSFPPTFAKNAVDRLKQGSLGGHVVLSCHPEASPQATIKWYKGNMEMSNVKPNGDLEMTALIFQDAGQYTCVATNDQGEARANSQLEVLEAMVFTEKPVDVEVEQNSTVYIPCKVSYDRNRLDITYEWKFYSHVIDLTMKSDDASHYSMPEQQVNSGKLYIKVAQFHHAGLYTCVVKSVGVILNASAVLTVRGPPGEPGGVHAKPIDDTLPQSYDNLAIWWLDGEVHGYPVTKYAVEFRSTYDEWVILQENIPLASVVTEHYPEWRKYKVRSGLSPGTAYQFRVKAGSDQTGYGPPSSVETIFYTMMTAAPIFAPSNVRGGGGSVGLLRIIWDPLPRSQWGANEVRYIVYYRRQIEGNNNRKWEMSEKLEQTEYDTVVGSEYYYTPYEVKVQGVNDVGNGPNTSVAIVYSAEDMPTNSMPVFDTVEVINGTAAKVFWKTVPNTREAARGTVFGYQVNYWEEDTTLCLGQNENEALFNRYYGDVNSGLLVGMSPEGHYCFNFQFINHAGMGSKTDNYNFNLNLSPPGYYPEFVSVLSHGNDSVRLYWRGVTVKVGEEAIQGYKAWWWNAREDIRTAKIETFDRIPTGVLHGVEKDVVYKVRVQAYGIGGDGKKSPAVYFTLEGQILTNPETEEILNTGATLKIALSIIYVMAFLVCCMKC